MGPQRSIDWTGGGALIGRGSNSMNDRARGQRSTKDGLLVVFGWARGSLGDQRKHSWDGSGSIDWTLGGALIGRVQLDG
jgi:hypothetical protein